MKEKIYSITLLLSFLVVVGHEMIPHHHHDLEEYGLSFQSDISEHHHHSDDFDLFNHSEENHQQETDNKHQHNFPVHHHLSADEVFDYIRIDFKKDSNVTYQLVAVLFSTSVLKIAPPPEIDFRRFTDKPFFITTIFEPGAIGLRAPPSIA